jgi:hypothetical protein
MPAILLYRFVLFQFYMCFRLVESYDIVASQPGLHSTSFVPLGVLIACYQGAAQAIEDGATLGVVLGKLINSNDIHAGLLVYEVHSDFT